MAEPKASQKLVLKKYALDEISKFKDPQERKNFLNTLSNKQLAVLCEWLSTWRENGVYRFIHDGPPKWKVEDVHFSRILVGRINDKVNFLLEKHDFILEPIAKDKTICEHDEFKSQSKIEMKTVIAQKSDDMFVLKDGIHRAIRAACDGQEKFKLMYY